MFDDKLIFEDINNPEYIYNSEHPINKFYKRDSKYLKYIQEFINSITNNLFLDLISTKFLITGSLIKSIFYDKKYRDFIKKDFNIYIFDESEDLYQDNTIIDSFNIKIINLNNIQIINFMDKLDNNLDKILYFNNKIYIHENFINDLTKLLENNKQFDKDPYINLPIDYLKILENKKKHSIIDLVNYLDLKSLSKFNVNILQSDILFKTTNINILEYSLYYLSIQKKNSLIIKNSIIEIIKYLNKIIFIRSPVYLCLYLNIDKLYPDLFKLISNNYEKINNNISDILNINNIDHDTNFNLLFENINNNILLGYSKCDNINLFKILINKYYSNNIIFKNKYKCILQDLIENIINFNSVNIMEYFVKNSNTSMFYKLYIILISQNFDLYKFIYESQNINNLLFNFIDDIINKNLLRSFYFLIKTNKENILNYKTENNNNILYILNNGSLDILKLLLNIKPDLLEDNNKIIIYYAQKNYYKLINYLLENKLIDIKYTDENSNTFLHILSMNGYYDTVKYLFKFLNKIINCVNKKNETAIILACKHNYEDIYNLLYSISNLEIRDTHGNTVYHYICLNKMCCNTLIPLIKNKYNFTPMDYCSITSSYYHFYE